MDTGLRRLALSSLLLGFVGPTPPAWLLDALADGLGGVVLFGSNLGDGTRVADLTDRLREAAGRDIVIALDEEGGDVTRLDTLHGSASPGAAALGHLDDPAATEESYAAIGARLAAAGITLALAPVADVNTEPMNPVIGVRSFGADPRLAARHVAAAVRGIQRGGTAACAKHFPGHGASRHDSHHEVAVIDAVEFEPFTAAIAAGTRAVMTGHLLVPAVDADNLATVSATITTTLLRGELGFTGTVVTDALEMRALSGTLGMTEGFVRALLAGADAVEMGAQDYPELVDQIPKAVAEAIAAGRLTTERLEDAAARTGSLAKPGDPDIGGDETDLGPRCIEILGELPALHAPIVVECRPPGGMASGELPWSLARFIPGSDLLTVTGDSAELPKTTGRSVVLVVRDPARHAWQRRLVDRADVVVDVGWPTERFTVPTIRTRGVAPPLLAAAADVLTGR